MAEAPDYLVHHVDEQDVTIDWFFGTGQRRPLHLILIIIGWFFVVLPVYITLSALVNRNNDDAGWWSYHEGFVMWEITMVFLGILTCFFIVGFLLMHLGHRRALRGSSARITYDQDRLSQRIAITDDWYRHKFGPEHLRRQLAQVRIEPYGDIETYELRGLFRKHEVE